MKKIDYICDGCDQSVEKSKLKSFYSGKYKQDVDLCEECIELLVDYVLKTASVLRLCKKCRGRGTIKGERIDTPCCGENRPEYCKKPCPECNAWKICEKDK